MSSILKSHHASAKRTILKAKELVGDNKVVSVKAMKTTLCLESYPCKGHGGARLTFEDDISIHVPCSSVGIGALMKYFTPDDMDPHFAGYVRELEIDDV